MDIRIKRIYEASSKDDGYRALVDRVWPRGVSRAEANIDCWAKELGPSHALRKWFNHVPSRWPDFVERYHRELESDECKCLGRALVSNAQNRGRLSLIYSAKNTEMNQAVVLCAWLSSLTRV
jgi:uncharacterized protein YeaO (DUF488 family)